MCFFLSYLQLLNLQNRNRLTDLENELMVVRVGEGQLGSLGWHVHTAVFNLKWIWASLVAQCLRIRLPVQGMQVPALVWEDPTCHGATKPRAPQLLSLRSRAHEPQLLSPHAPQLLKPPSTTTTEAPKPRAHAPQQEKSPQWEARALQHRAAPTRRN